MKKERFGVAVEPGILEKLREMAGGERKIGEFLTILVEREWDRRDAIAKGVKADDQKSNDHAELEERIRNLEGELREQDNIIIAMSQRMQRQARDLSYFRAVIDSAQTKEYTLEEYRELRRKRKQLAATRPDSIDESSQD